MDLALPLRSLAPSLDSDVLAVLAGTESALGATQISRLAGRSRQGVESVLARLVEHGLVIASSSTRGHMYHLNRAHLLMPALHAALDVRARLFELLVRETAQLAPAAIHVSVFGSFARGGGEPSSDIDLLVVTRGESGDSTTEWSALQRFQERILRATGNRVEVLVLSLDALRRAARDEEPIIGSLTEQSLRLHGPAFADLLAAEVSL